MYVSFVVTVMVGQHPKLRHETTDHFLGFRVSVLSVTVGLKHIKEAFSALFKRLAQPHVLESPAYAVLLQHCIFMVPSLYNTIQAEGMSHGLWEQTDSPLLCNAATHGTFQRT